MNEISYTFNLCHITYVAAHFYEKNKMYISLIKYASKKSGKI